jgi:hypothetical protein
LSFSPFAEPVGFTVAITDNFSFLLTQSFSPAGDMELETDVVLSPGDFGLVASDPAGGYVTVATAADPGGVAMAWERSDQQGFPVATASIAILPAGTRPHAAGVTLSSETLVDFLAQDSSGATSFESMWVSAEGIPLTAPFATQAPAADHGYQFLLDGSLVERNGGAFARRWTVGSTRPSALPGWLATRSRAAWLFPVRNGKGYAMSGTCGGIAVLAKTGQSCGCLPVPGLSTTTSIGRDGSLVVPLGDHYELYPLLFH